MGVNLSALMHYYLRDQRKRFLDLLFPALGLVICAYLWWSLGRKAHVVGALWLLTGVLNGAWRSSWFRKRMQFARLEGDEIVSGKQKSEVV